MKFLSYFAFMLFLFPFFSCQTNSLNIASFDKPCSEKSLDSMIIDSITFDSVFSYNNSMPALLNIIKQSARKHGFNIFSSTEKNSFEDNIPIISLSFREKNYTKGFKNVLSLGLIIEIKQRHQNMPSIIISYLHDGVESFDSFYHVQYILDQIFQSLRNYLVDNEIKQVINDSNNEDS